MGDFTRECTMTGKAICDAVLSRGAREVIICTIHVPAIYRYDIQVDGGYAHDEGFYDYDLDEATIDEDEPFLIVKLNGEIIENKNWEILKIEKVLKEDLQEI